MNLIRIRGANLLLSIPRVSGDEPSWLATVPDDMEYSPRERG